MPTSCYTLCDNVLAAVAADATLIAYCAAQFGKQPAYFLGFDRSSPPVESLCPWVAVAPARHGIDETQWNFDGSDIQVAAVIIDTSITNPTSAPGVITKYAGYEKAEGLAQAVYNAMNNYFGSTAVDMRNYAIDHEHPFYRATWNCRVATDL